MAWSMLTFGKHRGKSLPEVIFTDPDWFFWAVETGVFDNKGALKREASELLNKAKAIRIPNNEANDLVAEYVIHSPTGKLSHMNIVPAQRKHHVGSSPTYRKDVIDLSFTRQIARYDKLGCRALIASAKFVLFGNKSARMTRARCDEFFNSAKNFKT
jgi:hypothetical protein